MFLAGAQVFARMRTWTSHHSPMILVGTGPRFSPDGEPGSRPKDCRDDGLKLTFATVTTGMNGIFLVFFTLVPLFAVPPKVDTPPLDFKPAQAQRVQLKNGAVVYVLEDHELPLLTLNIRIRTSPADEKTPESFNFLGAVWRAGGTLTRSADQLNDELEQKAISIETGADKEVVTISLSCLSKELDSGLDLLRDVLLAPAFQADQLSLAKGKVIEGLLRKNETPNQIARRAFRDVVYGKNHVYAEEPNEKTVTKLTRNDLLALHKKVVIPDQAVISVAGAFKQEELLAKLEACLSGWKTSDRFVPSYDYSVTAASTGTLFFVPKEANQSRITIARLAPGRHNPHHFALRLTDAILGGGGPSRLFGEIRSRQGLAYMVGSFVQEPAGPGLLGVACLTKSESTLKAVRSILAELDKFTTGPLYDEEIKLAKDSLINSFVFGFDSKWEIVDARATNEFYGYTPDYLDTYTARLAAVTKEELGKTAKRFYSKDTMKVLVVGDEKRLDGSLRELGEVTVIPLKEIN
ncbi:MAG: hypothetical protein KCHDKBKB_02285 [Elusimicrobia bacterium]|nr:hypothetical protein [Elusimicrobiota bacterium]